MERDIEDVFLKQDNSIIPISGINIVSGKKQIVLDYINTRDIIVNYENYLGERKIFKELYTKLIETFPKLKPSELLIILEEIVISRIPFLGIDSGKIEKFKETNRKTKEEILKKINLANKLYTQAEKYIDTDSGIPDYEVTMTNISLSLSKRPIDIYNVIKKFKLSETIPFMITMKEYKDEPIVKYHQSLDTSLLKEWTFVGDTVKKPKGLNIKVLFKDNVYRNVNISRSTNNINIKLGLKNISGVKYDTIHNEVKYFNNFFKDIQSLIPKNDIIKDYEITIVNFSISFKLKTNIDIPKFVNVVSFRKEFNLNDTMSSTTTRFTYIDKNYAYSLKNTDNVTIVTINNLVTESNIRDSVQKLLTLLVSIDVKGKNLKENNVSNIKTLKEIGINVDSVDCQKIRQISVYTDNEKNMAPYTITLNNHQLYCKSKEFPYPGFTNKNNPCCFKKDQRKKPIFIKNTSSKNNDILVPGSNDTGLLSTTVITTDKVLDTGRLGILPGSISVLFNNDSNFLRLGVSQKSSFVSCVEYLTGIRGTVELIEKFLTKQVYNTLNFKNKMKTSYEEYKKNLTSQDFIKESVNIHDLLQKSLDIGIIVLDVKQDNTGINVLFPDYFWDTKDYSKYIFIMRTKGLYYEAIVLNKGKSLKKTFSKNDTEVIIINKVFKYIETKKSKLYINEPLDIKSLQTLGITIESQILNIYNKVEYINSDKGILPVKLSNPIIGIRQTTEFENLLTSTFQFKYLQSTPLPPEYHVIQQFVYKNKCVGLVTYSGIHVPVKPSKILDEIPTLENNIPYNVTTIFKDTEEANPVQEYMDNVKYNIELYQRCRLLLSFLLQPRLDEFNKLKNSGSFTESYIKTKEFIENLMKNTIELQPKTNIVTDIPSTRMICHITEQCNLDPFCSENCKLILPKEIFPQILDKLVTEIFNTDDIEKSKITKEFLDKNNFVQRDNEVIFLSKEELVEAVM